MSDEEFLKRWSRRKQEAKAAEAPPAVAGGSCAAAKRRQRAGHCASSIELDLSKLPPIDSITAATDITEFLRQGIPAELSRAALRRAWAADPTIRDFVGLAENAWDFTDPDAMPGFGALHGTPEQISAMVERVIGGVRDTAEKLASELPRQGTWPRKTRTRARHSGTRKRAPAEVKPQHARLMCRAEPVAAAQPEASDEERP